MSRLSSTARLVLLAVSCGCSSRDPPSIQPRSLTEATTLLCYHGPADAFGHPLAPAAGMRACEWHRPFVSANAGLCRQHEVALIDDVIPITYGLPFSDARGFAEAERAEFPNYAARFLGGCVLGDEQWVAVAYCPSCRAAELAWERASAAEGRPHPYDAAHREEIRRDVSAACPPPPLPVR